MEYKDEVLILTPVKDAEAFLETYFRSLYQLTYPRDLVSVAFLESDSVDNTYLELKKRLSEIRKNFRSAALWKKDFGFHIPLGTPRWAGHIQRERRAILAKSRNHLLFHALNDEDWVLWLDIDVIEYPSDIIERLLEVRKDIVQPNCVKQHGGISFDLNAWRDKGKLNLHDLKEEGNLVRLHSVGGTMLLIKADIHRDGLVFPPFLYGKENPLVRRNNFFMESKRAIIRRAILNTLEGIRKGDMLHAKRAILHALKGGCMGEIETEGLGMMAHDMGYECWGMPNLEIRHRYS